MSTLIAELKKDHAAITGILLKVKEFGVTSEEGQKLLADAKTGFLAHLKKEDEQLYPTLHSAAESNPPLQSTLRTFASEMKTVSSEVTRFFAKYGSGGSGGSGLDFAKDFGRLNSVLRQRIRNEETVLYTKFEQLAG